MQNCSRDGLTPKVQFSLYLAVVCLMQKNVYESCEKRICAVTHSL